MSTQPRVTTQSGIVQGLRSGEVNAFLGMPYAAPPVGALRWRAPQAATPWSGVLPATHFGASCPQPVIPQGFGPWTHEYVVQGDVNEDCLSLNVWAPADAQNKPCPVLVWIHGGAFASGAGSIAIYNGHALAAQGLVVVTINYRLGAFGFLAHPALGQACNFGLQDQIAALQWVQANIAAFGGDPNAVTVAGQSAGAVSVHLLVASPMAQGLFHRAIAQSGPPALVVPKTCEEAQADGLAFSAELGCTSIDAMRAQGAQALITAPSAHPRFGPVVDGVHVLNGPPSRHGNDVPMLVGQNADENIGLDPLYADGDRAYREAALDRWLGALWVWAEQRAKVLRAPLYAYLFDHVEPGPDAARYGCFHTSEVPYAFGTLDAAPERGYTEVDRYVSAMMSRYWINFVRFGNPNGKAPGDWPALDAASPLLMRLGQRCEPQSMLAPAKLSALREHLRASGVLKIF